MRKLRARKSVAWETMIAFGYAALLADGEAGAARSEAQKKPSAEAEG
jgi:hypothetical protein